MSTTRTIANIEVYPVLLPATRTFQFASGKAATYEGRAPVVIVKMTDSEGVVGWGEGRAHPNWSYETFESVVSTIRKHLTPAVKGLEIWDRIGFQKAMHSAVGRGPSTGMPIAKAALDIALHDVCARAAGVPLRAFLGGGVSRNVVELSWTCTAHDAAAAKDDVAEGLANGMKHFNFKAAVDRGSDSEVARTIAGCAPAGAFLWADANQGLLLHEAARLGDLFHELGVHLLEQPLAADQLHLMRALRQRTRIPLAVDEASVSPGDFFHYATEGLVDYFVLKITRSGGIGPSLIQMQTAVAAGLPFVTSGLTDGLLTKLAACQVAAAFGGAPIAALNGSQFMDESALYPGKPAIEHDGAIHLPNTPGLGVEPDASALKDLTINMP